LVLLSFSVGAPAQQERVREGWLQTEVEQTVERPLTLAILDFGDSSIGRQASEKLASSLRRDTGLIVSDRDQVRAAARGAGYAGSINLSLNEARDLGAALGCDFFIVGDAQLFRRSPSTGPIYFDLMPRSLRLARARVGLSTGNVQTFPAQLRPLRSKHCFPNYPGWNCGVGSSCQSDGPSTMNVVSAN